MITTVIDVFYWNFSVEQLGNNHDNWSSLNKIIILKTVKQEMNSWIIHKKLKMNSSIFLTSSTFSIFHSKRRKQVKLMKSSTNFQIPWKRMKHSIFVFLVILCYLNFFCLLEKNEFGNKRMKLSIPRKQWNIATSFTRIMIISILYE